MAELKVIATGPKTYGKIQMLPGDRKHSLALTSYTW